MKCWLRKCIIIIKTAKTLKKNSKYFLVKDVSCENWILDWKYCLAECWTVKELKIYTKIDKNHWKTWNKMHLATEVTSTTNHQLSTSSSSSSSMDTKGAVNENNNQTKTDPSAKSNNNGFLTAQELAERTIDSLLAEHPGELVRTGSPHIVIITFLSSKSKKHFRTQTRSMQIRCIWEWKKTFVSTVISVTRIAKV